MQNVLIYRRFSAMKTPAGSVAWVVQEEWHIFAASNPQSVVMRKGFSAMTDNWRMRTRAYLSSVLLRGFDRPVVLPRSWKSGLLARMNGTQSHPVAKHHDSGLLAIGILKVLEAALSVAVGLGVLHLLNKDLNDELTNLVRYLHLNEDGRLVSLAFDKLDLIDNHRLKQIGASAFAYGALKLVEGVGLVREKVWAEYLTVIASLIFLPWELYELARHPNIWRLGILIANLLIVAYLLWTLSRMRRRKQQD